MEKPRNSWLALLLGLTVWSCYEKVDGCLDADASNFSIVADIDCGCCEYPNLVLDINHIYDTLSFNVGTTYHNALGQPFSINHFALFVSDVQVRRDTQWLNVTQTIDISSTTGEVTAEPDDATVLSRTGFQFEVGEFTNSGHFEQVQFLLGLSEPELSADPEDFEEGHPLAPDGPLTEAAQYHLFELGIVRDTATMEIDTITLAADQGQGISINFDLTTSRGSDLRIPITVDYARWFENLDLLTDDAAALAEKIVDGIPHSFSANQ